MTASQDIGTVVTDPAVEGPELMRLRAQLATREKVIGQLNARLREQESRSALMEREMAEDLNATASFHARVRQLENTYVDERRIWESERTGLNAELAQMRTRVRSYESLPGLTLAIAMGRKFRALQRRTGR